MPALNASTDPIRSASRPSTQPSGSARAGARIASVCLAILLSLSGAPGVAGVVAAEAAGPASPVTAGQATDDDTTDPPAVDGVVEDPTDGDSVDAENRRIMLIILGLVAVAIALMLLTIRYWRQTKPVPLPADESDEVGPGDLPSGAPDATAEVDDDPFADIFEPATEPSRRSRRAVAGADHPEVDERWVPRGTGEHDRIEVTETPSISKPTADQRAAALSAKRGN